MSQHSLDRPVWNSLRSGWAHLAQAEGQAVRLDPDYGPFAAVADTQAASLGALRNLIPTNGELWLVEREPALALLPGFTPLRQAELVQMLASDIKGEAKPVEIVALSEADAAEMIALAHLTKPGPFAVHTNRLAEFVGVKADGKLIAMCGERMKLPGYSELSGLCTHPDFQGQGLGGALMRHVARRILARGEQVFLHAYTSHSSTVAFYQSLGFDVRAVMTLAVFDGVAGAG